MRFWSALLILGGCEGDALLDDPTRDAGTFRPCDIDYDVDVDTVIDPSICAVFGVVDTIDIQNGATFTILAGTELRFEKGQGITIGRGGGRLVLDGTKDKPVVMTSLDPDPTPAARWAGILFLGETLPGSTLSHAIIRNAGNAEDDAARGCVAVRNTVRGAVRMEDVLLERCTGGALVVDAEGIDVRGATLEIAESELGLVFGARNVGNIEEPLRYRQVSTNVIRGGPILESTRWIGQAVPWRVEGDVLVEGSKDPVLTLDTNLSLTFAPSTALRVGDAETGALVVHGTTDAPITLEPSSSGFEGAWHGVVLGRFARAAIDFAVIRGGGQLGLDVRGCLTILGTAPVSITSSTFDGCGQAGIAAVDPSFEFALLASNRFSSSEIGLSLPSAAVGSVVEEQIYVGVSANAIEGGDVAKSAVWKSQPVPWRVRGNIEIQGSGGPVLEIEPGAIFQFDPGKWMQVGSSGQLTAGGTASSPITFEASGRSWPGLIFGEGATGMTRLDGVVVKNGGESGSDSKGCVTIRGSARDRSISIDRSVFEGCSQAGVAATEGDFVFTSFAGNTFRNMEIGLHLAASSVSSISTPQSYEEVRLNRIEAEPILKDSTWWPQSIPWILAGAITIDGAASPILNINPGTEVLLEASALVLVGMELGGGLVVTGTELEPVRLVSASTPESYGDWHGIVFGPMTNPGSRLELVEMGHAGRLHQTVRGAITLDRTESRVQIGNVTFFSNLGADIFVDCGSQPLLTSNVYSTTGLVLEAGCM